MKNLFLAFLLICVTVNGYAQNNDAVLAQQYYMKGDFAKAVVYYEKLYKQTPSHANFARYLDCLIQTKELSDAEKLIKKQLKVEPDNIENDFIYGDFLENNNRISEADKLYQRLIKDKARSTLNVKLLFNSFKDAGKMKYAKQTLEYARKTFGNNYPLNLEFAQVYYSEKDYSKMMDELLNYLESYPGKTDEVKQQLSPIMEGNADDIELQNTIRNAIVKKIQRNSDGYQFSDLLIWYFSQRREFDIALTQVIALDKREKGQGRRVYDLGLICVQNKDYSTAVKAFKYVAILAQSFLASDAQRALLKVRYYQITEGKDYDQTVVKDAILAYKNALDNGKSNRVNYEMYLDLAHLFAYYDNNTAEAIRILKNVLSTQGLTSMQIAQAKMDLADIDVLTNNIWDASLLYMQVDKDFKYEPIGFEAKFKNARIFYYSGDFKFAQNQLDVLKQSTTKLIANDALKLSVLITDNFGLDSNYQAMSLFAHADLLLEQHLYNKAFKLYDSLAKEFPESGLMDDIALRKGKTMMEQGKWDDAIRYFNEIVQYHSDDILIDDALFYLGEIYQDHKKDMEKAMEYFKKILFEHPSSLYCDEVRKRIREIRGES